MITQEDIRSARLIMLGLTLTACVVLVVMQEPFRLPVLLLILVSQIVFALAIIAKIHKFRRRMEPQQAKITFYCVQCGRKHNKITCPSCGSKTKRTTFE